MSSLNDVYQTGLADPQGFIPPVDCEPVRFFDTTPVLNHPEYSSLYNYQIIPDAYLPWYKRAGGLD